MSRIREYTASGPASPSRARTAGLVDAAFAYVLAMVAFPFPFARAALPVWAFVLSIIATLLFVHFLYLLISLAIWTRTPGYFLFDLGLDPRDGDPWNRVRWSATWVLAALPGLAFRGLTHPTAGLPVRLSSIETVSTRDTEASG